MLSRRIVWRASLLPRAGTQANSLSSVDGVGFVVIDLNQAPYDFIHYVLRALVPHLGKSPGFEQELLDWTDLSLAVNPVFGGVACSAS